MSEGVEPLWRGGRPSILVGRTAAMAFTAFHFYFFVAYGAGAATTEAVALVILLGVAVVAVALAWYSAARGALALAAVGLSLAAFGAVAADHGQVSVALLLGVPYFLAAVLLWFGTRRLAGTLRPSRRATGTPPARS